MAISISKISIMLEMYEFEFPTLPDRLKCIICNSILKNAKQTSCGCKVCEKCIKEYLSSGPKLCPSKQPDCENILLNIDTDINLDTATNKEIGNLKAECPSPSCTYTTFLKEMIDHINKCEFREVICENCKLKLPAKNKSIHDVESCPMRNSMCIYCKENMKDKDLREIHLNPDRNELCPKFSGICPNDCNIKTKVNLKEHLAVCIKKKLDCPFHALDCDIGKMTKENLLNHLRDECISHNSSLVVKIKNLELKVENLNSEKEIQNGLIQELLSINRKTSQNFIKLEKSFDEYKKKPSASIQTVERSVIFRNGSFIWKISDFQSRKMDAINGIRVSVTSDPFYTSDFGYKMCLRIYPAGDGVGKHSHLSVFFALMKGDYDDLLAWPFKQKVTLSILDQDFNQKNYSDTFKPDVRSACYQKPVDECNIASGSPKFIDLESVMAPPYCKNDTIYLKISVDTLGISKP